MGIRIGDRDISSVWLLDDDPRVRETYVFPVEELKLKSVPQDESFADQDIDAFVRKFRADAAICDHHLTPNNYAPANGADLVARWYDLCLPAILCTKVVDVVEEVRPFRRRIPVLINDISLLDPDSVRCGFATCIAEFKGTFSPARREWRTLVRVVEVDTKTSSIHAVYVVVPAWDPDKEIKLLWGELPKHVQEVLPKATRLRCHVNLGAEAHGDLFFEKWELL